MFGLSAVSMNNAGAYSSKYLYQTGSARSTAPVSAIAPAETTPVPPVSAVASVPQTAAQNVPEDVHQLPSQQLGADPVEMAVRSRIQYVDDAQQPTSATASPLTAEQDVSEAKSAQEVMEESQCQTCKERKYQDGSDDPGVSYKTPTTIAPEQAATAVRSHEQEHVVREQSKAQREDREVVSQSVTLHTAICPECGRTYISGGTTRTTTRAENTAQNLAQRYQQAEQAPSLFEAIA